MINYFASETLQDNEPYSTPCIIFTCIHDNIIDTKVTC